MVSPDLYCHKFQPACRGRNIHLKLGTILPGGLVDEIPNDRAAVFSAELPPN